jgi:hypothetical protein
MARRCRLGLHDWHSISRYQRVEGVLYEITYMRCIRAGCRRYPTYRRYDVSPVKR